MPPRPEGGISGVRVQIMHIGPYRAKQVGKAADHSLAVGGARRLQPGILLPGPLTEQGVPLQRETRGSPARFDGRLRQRQRHRNEIGA